MKKISSLFVLFAMLMGSVAHADSGRNCSKNNSENFQWGIALVSLAVVGAVVGLTAASAASTPNTYSTNHD